MNVYDSDKMGSLLENVGMIPVEKFEDADVVILNTCHIREKAKHKVYTELGFLKSIRAERVKKGLDSIICVGGCVAQAEGEEILGSSPFVDLIFGTQVYHELASMLSEVIASRGSWNSEKKLKEEKLIQIEDSIYEDKIVSRWSNKETNRKTLLNIDFPKDDKFDFLPKESKRKGSAFLVIQEGCDKFCTYCVVPYTRGVEISRPAQDILEEAKIISDNGVSEITLLGQNVNAYHGASPSDSKKSWNLARLLYAVSEINNIKRIFYTTSHPIDFDDELVQAHSDLPKLMPFVHLPVQSGSNRILKAMNRKHRAEDYIEIISSLRKAQPRIAFSSDFIVGFPNETNADFQETLSLVNEVNYSQAFSFKYSRRFGTVACDLPDQIDEDVKEERLAILQNILQKQQTDFNKSCIGQILSVMFQRLGKFPGQALGKSEFMQSVIIECEDPKELQNTTRKVLIKEATMSSVSGEIVD